MAAASGSSVLYSLHHGVRMLLASGGKCRATESPCFVSFAVRTHPTLGVHSDGAPSLRPRGVS